MQRELLFRVVASRSEMTPRALTAYLVEDKWDDWAEFRTQSRLILFNEKSEELDIGDVKIGALEMSPEMRRVPLRASFTGLPAKCFSLGQEVSYYAVIAKLPGAVRTALLAGLRDVVADRSLFEKALKERVTIRSLLRFVPPLTVRGQFRRVLDGGSPQTPFRFSFVVERTIDKSRRKARPATLPLHFDVRVDSSPPTNIHAIIGSNGTGKSHILRQMWRGAGGPQWERDGDSAEVGTFTVSSDVLSSAEVSAAPELFANVFLLSFNAFDGAHDRVKGSDSGRAPIARKLVSLFKAGKGNRGSTPKSQRTIEKDFSDAVMTFTATSPRQRMWREALTALSTEGGFAEMAEQLGALDADDGTASRAIFRSLSAGHKIVLLAMARLIEQCTERTLVLIDEPENHLHPPLLAAYIRALSDVLAANNSVAILATHSPIVVQELPQSCVWHLLREGDCRDAMRPSIATFGENVGTLTADAFGLEVRSSGFCALVRERAAQAATYEEAIASFSEGLGSEARAHLLAIFARRRSGGDA